MEALRNYITKKYSQLIIWLFIPIAIITSFSHHPWVHPEKVIEWDVKSYYAYLPAAFVHHDLSLSFIKDNPKEYGKWFWPVVTPTGGKCIVTSMGLSILYAPFFFIAHIVASFTSYANDGYSEPYAFALHFSSLFYLIIGLFYLRRLLLKFFSQVSVAITLIVVFIGTNLFYYTAYAATMSHAYNFALICIYTFYVDKWYERKTYKLTIFLGVLSGLITLVRPTNILVLVILYFWKCATLKDIKSRTVFFLQNYRHVLLMILFFFLIWIPQFAYWKYVSGKFLYFSYGNLDAKFYWANPQIFDILFSYRKGWWVYTPVMLISTIGIVFMMFKMKKLYLSILIFLVFNIYVQSSWWCWWFGGSYGNRAFIDSYGIMAIPLATLIQQSLGAKTKGYILLFFIGVLTWYNTFQIKQFNHQALHYWWMSRTGYWMNFLHSRPVNGYWESVPVPDYDKARKGVYVAKNLIQRFNGYNGIKVSPSEIVSEIRRTLVQEPGDKRLARQHSISVDSAITIRAWNIYERKWSLDSYIRPLLVKKITDSLLIDSLQSNKYKEINKADSLELFDEITKQTLHKLENTKF